MNTELNRPIPSSDNPPGIWSDIDVLLITIAIISLILAGIVGYRYVADSIQPQGTQNTNITLRLSIGVGILESAVFIGCVYFLGIRRRKLPWSAAGLCPTSADWIVKGILLGLAVIPLSGLITIVIQLSLGKPLGNPQLPFLAPEGFSWTWALSMILLGGLAAPFAEELYFRGVLYPWLRQRWGIWISTLSSALVFAMVHGEVSIAGAAFVLGIILAWSYEQSGSLWPSVLIHALNNSFKIILLYFMLAHGLIPPTS